MAKALNGFLFANKRASGSSGDTRHQNAGKVEELRVRSDFEFDRMEQQAREKLAAIRCTRLEAAPARLQQNIEKEFANMEEELQLAMEQEKEYQKCSYRRTACKALQGLVQKFNLCRQYGRYTVPHAQFAQYGEYKETTNFVKCSFNQLGEVATCYHLLVDPGRFWSYDLVNTSTPMQYFCSIF